MAEAATTSRRRPPPGTGATDIASGEVAIRQLPARARLALRIDPGLLPAGGAVAGFALDAPINRWRASARGRALRLGPDEWLLWAPDGEAARVADDMAAALAGRHLSVVDISHGRAAFAVSGTEAAAVLNSGCPLDLSPAAFPADAATRTLLGKCEVILARTDGRPTFEVECGRSFAPYLRELMLAALRGYG